MAESNSGLKVDRGEPTTQKPPAPNAVPVAGASGAVSHSDARRGSVFTYIGGGEDSPRVINFMGKQEFVRGKATEVTDAEILAKIEGNPTFVEGKVSEEEIHALDTKAGAAAVAQRAKDEKLNKLYHKNHKTE